MWYPTARNKGDWIRKAVPDEGQWTREQWELYAKEKLGNKPGVSIKGMLAGAGGIAFALQRMGFSPAASYKTVIAAGVAGGGAAGTPNGSFLAPCSRTSTARYFRKP